jgi:hypothetical protein
MHRSGPENKGGKHHCHKHDYSQIKKILSHGRTKTKLRAT